MQFSMTALDWSILFFLIILLVCVLVYCQKHVKNTADFLAANRCAGRYLLAITSGIASIGAISVIALFEQYYVSGFASTWWGFLSGPIGLLIGITGWVYYRLRETRCFTVAQFFEVRYSRRFRIFCGILGWISGILNYGIFPAVSVKFFIYFCRLPQSFHIGNLPFEFSTYVCLMLATITLGCTFAIFGGQIAIMITDFIQGIFCNIAFLILMIYLLGTFRWETISSTLIADAAANPGSSLFNPYETTAIQDFNIWFFIMGIAMIFMQAGSWQGNSGYSAAAKNAHEAQMAHFLGTWRGLIQGVLLLFIPICAYVFFRNSKFASHAAVVEQAIGKLDPQLATQARVPLFLAYVLPKGLVGLFAAMMFAAMLSTDDTYMHSWGTIFIQDILLPLRKKPMTPREHLKALRWSIIFVGAFSFCFSYLFKQTDYILMFMQLTGAIFMGGAGAVLIGGLYSKIGTTTAAWISMITGSVLSCSAILCQQMWGVLCPFFIRHIPGGRICQWLTLHQEKFPFNGFEISFYIGVFGFALYFVVSFLDRRLHNIPEFNMDRMLHRGKYDTKMEHKENWNAGRIWKLLGLTNEFTLSDRILFFASLGWTLLWFSCFILGSIGHVTRFLTAQHWMGFWKFYIGLGFFLGVGTTIWFLLYGTLDIRKLFQTLSTMKRNDDDNGTVTSDGTNAGE